MPPGAKGKKGKAVGKKAAAQRATAQPAAPVGNLPTAGKPQAGRGAVSATSAGSSSPADDKDVTPGQQAEVTCKQEPATGLSKAAKGRQAAKEEAPGPLQPQQGLTQACKKGAAALAADPVVEPELDAGYASPILQVQTEAEVQAEEEGVVGEGPEPTDDRMQEGEAEEGVEQVAAPVFPLLAIPVLTPPAVPDSVQAPQLAAARQTASAARAAQLHVTHQEHAHQHAPATALQTAVAVPLAAPPLQIPALTASSLGAARPSAAATFSRTKPTSATAARPALKSKPLLPASPQSSKHVPSLSAVKAAALAKPAASPQRNDLLAQISEEEAAEEQAESQHSPEGKTVVESTDKLHLAGKPPLPQKPQLHRPLQQPPTRTQQLQQQKGTTALPLHQQANPSKSAVAQTNITWTNVNNTNISVEPAKNSNDNTTTSNSSSKRPVNLGTVLTGVAAQATAAVLQTAFAAASAGGPNISKLIATSRLDFEIEEVADEQPGAGAMQGLQQAGRAKKDAGTSAKGRGKGSKGKVTHVDDSDDEDAGVGGQAGVAAVIAQQRPSRAAKAKVCESCGSLGPACGYGFCF